MCLPFPEFSGYHYIFYLNLLISLKKLKDFSNLYFKHKLLVYDLIEKSENKFKIFKKLNDGKKDD